MSVAEARLKLELAHRAAGQMREATSFEDLEAAMHAFLSAARSVRILVTAVAEAGDGDRIERVRFAAWLARATRNLDPPLPLGELHLGHDFTLAYAPRPARPIPRAALTIGRSRRDTKRQRPPRFASAAVYFTHDHARPATELCMDYLVRLSAFVDDASAHAAALDEG